MPSLLRSLEGGLTGGSASASALLFVSQGLIRKAHLEGGLTGGSASASALLFVSQGLIRKAHLAVNIKKYVAKRPGCALAAGVPETLLFEMWRPDCLGAGHGCPVIHA